MRAFVLKEPGVVGYVDVPEPRLTPYGAILRPVAVAPCSSDVHTVFGGGSRKAPNLVLGHECVAEVLEVGELVEEFRPGEIVAVPAITPNWRDRGIQERNFKHASAPFSGHQLGRSQPGVFAEKFLIPDADTTLAKIPAGLSLEQALMCVDEGVMRPVSLPVLRQMITASIESFLADRSLAESGVQYVAVLEEMISILLEGVLPR